MTPGAATAAPPEATRIEQFKEEAGEAVGAMPPKEPPADPGPEFDSEIVVKGTTEQLSFDVGGRGPTGSELRVVGGAIQVKGQFQKGQVIKAEVTLQVGEIAFRDKRDSQTGDVVDVKRAHKARIVELAIQGED